jgi:hypothetical protein
MVKLGDKRSVYPGTFEARGKNGVLQRVTGTVAYIHPASRYCVLEFDIGERIREAFQLIRGELPVWYTEKPKYIKDPQKARA